MPTEADWVFDFSQFYLPDGLYERLVCAVIAEESAADPEITYYFSAGPNVTNLTVGPSITVPAKNAHDYLWVFYDKQEDTTAKKLVAQPLQANVERVYEAGDFSNLSI